MRLLWALLHILSIFKTVKIPQLSQVFFLPFKAFKIVLVAKKALVLHQSENSQSTKKKIYIYGGPKNK